MANSEKSRIIDLSYTVEATPPDVPEFMVIEIDYTLHQHGADELEKGLGIPRRLLRNEEGAAGEHIKLGTHATTHLDAPWHYNSHIDGVPAPTIDELPVDWFYGPGVVVDARGRADDDPITAAEMEELLAATGHELDEGDIVLVHTGCDAFAKEPDFMMHGCGVTAEATLWLYERGVRVMGIDAFGWDGPVNVQVPLALERDEPGIFWAAHQCGVPYSHIERLTNLAALPPTGFHVACFPMKIKRAGAAPARVVAILDDVAAG